MIEDAFPDTPRTLHLKVGDMVRLSNNTGDNLAPRGGIARLKHVNVAAGGCCRL